MTPQQITLVRASWVRIVPISDTAAELFYGRLFELDPSLRSLFKGDMKQQGRKLMTMITTAVNALDQLDEIVPAVHDLGRRHLSYGVKDANYDTVGEALLWTLKEGLGKDFTPETGSAWATVYGLLADAMKEGAAQSARSQG